MRRTVSIGFMVFATLGTGGAGALHAQSAQRLSGQVSLLSATVFGEEFEGWGSGVGFEGQLRYTHSAWSIGGGWQQTSHSVDENEVDLSGFDVSLKLSGPFIEPRYVIPTRSSTVAPYLSARFSILRESGSITDGFERATFSASGGTINGGGGILIRAGDRINVDIGATYGYTSFGEGTIRYSGGTDTSEATSGSNVIVRIGVSIGIGS